MLGCDPGTEQCLAFVEMGSEGECALEQGPCPSLGTEHQGRDGDEVLLRVQRLRLSASCVSFEPSVFSI